MEMNFIFHMNVVQSVLKFILTIHIFAMNVLITPKLLIGYGKRQPNKMNTIIVISGRGSNMSALLDHNIKVTAVLSNVPDAPGLKIARNRGIKCVACNAVQEVCDMIEELSPDLVCLAGFMRILPQHITEKFQVMNIHPSLLPRFPGLHAQKQAFESGVSYSGCTVHMVDGGVDTGKIIVQKAVPILLNDTVESLSTRILKQEHKAYAEAVRMFTGQQQQQVTRPNIGKPFQNMDEAVRSALDSDTSYMWQDAGTIMISDRQPESIPHVVATRGDTADILQSRLNNMVTWNHIQTAIGQKAA